jgi:hypothetical protein
MVGLQNKNGVYYAFDRSAISSSPLWQKRLAAGGICPECATGAADISPSAYDGQRLLVGGEKTTIGGVACKGSIRELQPSTGKAVWADCLKSGAVLGAVSAPSVSSAREEDRKPTRCVPDALPSGSAGAAGGASTSRFSRQAPAT